MVLSPSSAVSPERVPSNANARLESFGESVVSPGSAIPLSTLSPRRNHLSPLPPLRIRPSLENQSSPQPSFPAALPARPSSASSSPSSMRKAPLVGAALERRDSRLLDRQQSRAVEEERTRCAQLPGRDAVASINSNGGSGGKGGGGSGSGGSQQLAWSDIKRLHPWRWQMARLGYRLEVFLESATHRVYALIALAALVLLASMAAFLVVALMSGEYSALAADARVGGNAAKYEWAGRSGTRSSSARTKSGAFWFGRNDVTDDVYEIEDDEEEADIDHANTLIYAGWLIWTCFVDTAPHVQKFDRARLPYTLAVACCVSLLGILFFSVVLGFSVDLLAAAAKGITEGDFQVPEKGHFLVLGYSTKAVAVVTELAMAMASSHPPPSSMFSWKTKGCIVVLADYPSKQEFDYQVNTQLRSLGLEDSVRVVFRRGSPLYAANLAKVAPEASRAIIVLSDTREDPGRADAQILNVVLGLKALLEDGRAAPDRDRMEVKPQPSKQLFFSPSKDRGKVLRGLNRNAMSSRSFSTGLEGFRDFLTSPHDQVPSMQSSNSGHSDGVASGSGSGIGSISENDVTSSANTSPSARRRWSLTSSMSSSQIDENATVTTTTELPTDASPPPFQRKLTRRLSLAVPTEDEDVSNDSSAKKVGNSNSPTVANDTKNGTGVYNIQRKWYQGHIVAELADIDSRPLIQVCGGKSLELLVVHDLVGQLLAKSAAHPSASRVLNPILGFDGCECYFKSHSSLLGCTLREASLRLSGAILVGIRKSASSTSTTPEAVAAGSSIAVGAPAKKGLRRKGSKLLLHPEGRAHALKMHHAKKPSTASTTAEEKTEAKHALGSKQSSSRSSRSFDGTTMGASLSEVPMQYSVETSSEAFALAAHGLVDTSKVSESGGIFTNKDEAEYECVIEEGDELVLIAEDANSYQVLLRPFYDPSSSLHCRPWPPPPLLRDAVNQDASNAGNELEAGVLGSGKEAAAHTNATNRRYRGLTAFEHLEYAAVAAKAAQDDAAADANAALFPTAHLIPSLEAPPASAPAPVAPLQLARNNNDDVNSITNSGGDGIEMKSSIDGSADGLVSVSSGVTGETGLSLAPTPTTGALPQVWTAPEDVPISPLGSSRLAAETELTAAEPTEATPVDSTSTPVDEQVNAESSRAAKAAAERVASAAAPSMAWRLNGMHVLVCGWRRDVKDLIRELDQSLPPRSSATILCDRNVKEVSSYLKDYCSKPTNGLLVQHVYARPDVRHQLEKSGALQFAHDSTHRKVDVIVVVAEEDQERDLLLSDSQVLATVLLIRDLHVQHLVSNGQVSQPPTPQPTYSSSSSSSKNIGQLSATAAAASEKGEKSVSEKVKAQAEGESSLSSLSRTQLEKLQVDLPIVAEVLDVAAKATIAESPALNALADYVVVHDIAAKLLAAAAERREVASILTEFMGSAPGTVGLRAIEASALLCPNELVADPVYATVPLDGQSPPFPVPAPDSQQQQQSSGSRNLRGPLAASTPPLPFARSSAFKDNASSSSSSSSRGSNGSEPVPSSVPCRPVSFAELSLRCLAPPVRGILVGYIKATQPPNFSAYSNNNNSATSSGGSSNGTAQSPRFAASTPTAQPMGPKVTVINPAGKGAPLYWHQGDFLVMLAAGDAASHADARSPLATRRFPVVR